MEKRGGRKWGGGKRGQENFRNDTPPKKAFWTTLVRCVFHPSQSSVLCFSCTKIHDRAEQKLFWGRVQNFRESAFCVTLSSPPYALHPPPPHITAQPWKNSCAAHLLGRISGSFEWGRCRQGRTEIPIFPVNCSLPLS